jgi:hypothetical protein
MRALGTAQAPGGKSRADPPPVHRDPAVRGVQRRVFAISSTLLVLEIESPSAYSNLVHCLVELWPSISPTPSPSCSSEKVWTNHHVMFDHIWAADRFVQLLNTPPPLKRKAAKSHFRCNRLAGWDTMMAATNGNGRYVGDPALRWSRRWCDEPGVGTIVFLGEGWPRFLSVVVWQSVAVSDLGL